MIKTINDSVKYIAETINEIEKSEEPLDEMFVKETFMDALLDKIEEQNLSQEILEKLEEKSDDQEYIESYLANKIPNYYTILNDLCQEIITDYLTEGEESEEAVEQK